MTKLLIKLSNKLAEFAKRTCHHKWETFSYSHTEGLPTHWVCNKCGGVKRYV